MRVSKFQDVRVVLKVTPKMSYTLVNNALNALGGANDTLIAAVRSTLLDALAKMPPTTLNEKGAIAVSLTGMMTKGEDLDLWGCIIAANMQAVRGSSTSLVAFLALFSKIGDPLARAEVYRFIAYQRDISDGKGERDITYTLLFEVLSKGYGDEVKLLLKLFPTVGYGYWGDLVNFYNYIDTCGGDSNMKSWILKTLMHQARHDEMLLKNNNKASISLVGKWLPSENKKKDNESNIAKELAVLMFPKKGSFARYRQLLSKLRNHLKVVERSMSSNKWGEIDPSATPAKAMKKYRKVFMNPKGSEDEGRVLLAEKLTALISGKTDKVIKTKGLQFYELIKTYVDGEGLDEVIEAQCKTIIKDLQLSGRFPLSVALCDVSGSMTGIPMIVSIALGLLVANIMPAPWGGRVITFETKPRWVSLPTSSSIWEQVRVLKDAPWGGATNFTAAVDLVLHEALRNKSVPAPKFLFVFTDMQFDAAAEDKRSFVIDVLKAKFARHELVMPNMVLWNLRASGTCSFAADKDTPGVAMLSGFSQSAFKVFTAGCNFEDMSPTSLLMEVLHSSRYDAAAACVKEEVITMTV